MLWRRHYRKTSEVYFSCSLFFTLRPPRFINRLGESADVADMINELCKGIVEVSSCYNGLAKKLNDYSDSWCNKINDLFRNVLIGTVTVAGLFVLFIVLFIVLFTLQKFVRSFL